MSFCPKCGNKIDQTMSFCPNCGVSLKSATVSRAAPTQSYGTDEKDEKNLSHGDQDENKNPEEVERQEKGEHGFVVFLMGGLILITIGIFSIMDLTSYYFTSSQDLAIMLFIIGIIIISGAVYVVLIAWKRFPRPHLIGHPESLQRNKIQRR